MNYITTNIRFPEDIYFELKEEAYKRRTSLASIIREKLTDKRNIVRKEEFTKKSKKIDAAAAMLGKKLRGFDAVAAIRSMREERK